MDRAKILVVADGDEAGRIARWLEAASVGVVRTGEGDDDTVAEFERDPADVIVLCAGLAKGDALALAGALRGQGGSHVPLVLIGEVKGPVRTALDAMDYGADRFLRRPLAQNALVFSVKSLVAALPAGGAGVVGGVAGRLSTGIAPQALGAALTLTDRHDTPAASPEPAAGVAAFALASRFDAADADMMAALIHDAVDDVLAHPPPADPAEAREDDEPAAAEPAPPPPEEQLPSWREPTQILSGGAKPPVVPASPVAAPEPPLVAAAAPAPANGTPPIAPDEARTGTIARELRRTMSAIEKRLFGGGDTQVSAEPPPEEEPSGDIDLDKIGIDTAPSLGAEDLRMPRGRGAAEPDPELDAERDVGLTTTARRVVSRTPVPSLRGDLAAEDVSVLIARLYREGYTGKVTFTRGEAVKSIFFEEGRPVFATSNLPHDRMGDLLYREGKITREQHAKSREIVAETGRRMGEILVEMGFLKRRELLPAVRRHVEDVAYSLFAWDSGEYATAPGEDARGEKIRLATHPTALVVEGIRRKMGIDRLRQRLSAESVVAPLKRDDIAAALAEADLSPEERHAADLFDGRRTLAEVQAASQLEEAAVWQLACALLALGLARRLERGRDLTDGGRPAAPASAPSLAGAADVAIDRERVLAKHSHVLEADYFTILGVRRDATAFEIRRAWEAARKDYAPEAFPHEVQRELAEPLREIAAVLDEAFRVLREDRIREQYLAHLRG